MNRLTFTLALVWFVSIASADENPISDLDQLMSFRQVKVNCFNCSSSNAFVAQQRAEMQKTRASLRMTNGYVCLSVGSALFLTASILAFIAGTRRTLHGVEGKG